MPRKLIPLFLALLLTVPAGLVAANPTTEAAWGFDVAAFHVGDQVRYSDLASDGRRITVVEALAPAKVVDRFGVERMAERFLTVDYLDGEIENGWLCSVAVGTRVTLRRDIVAGVPAQDGKDGKPGRDVSGDPLLWDKAVAYDWSLVSDFPETCLRDLQGPHPRTGTRVTEGERRTLTEISGRSSVEYETVSAPAVRIRFSGHDAIEFRFNVTAPSTANVTAAVGYVFAEGLPGLAARRTILVDAAGNVTETGGSGITAIRAGDGRALAAHTPTSIPAIASRSQMPAGRLAVNDAGLELAFPYAQAYRAARDDPVNEFGGFLAAHPDAKLVNAVYDRRMRMSGGMVSAGDAGHVNAMDGVETDGGWALVFTDGTRALGLEVIRASGARTHDGAPLTTGQSAAKKITVQSFNADPQPVAAADATVLTANARATLARAHGIAPGSVETFSYQIRLDAAGNPRATTYLSQIPPGWSSAEQENLQGVALTLDEGIGGVQRIDNVWKTSRPSTPVPSLRRDAGIDTDPLNEPATLSLSSAPIARGEGLSDRDTRLLVAAAGLTGFAVLLLALKFVLLPLFTRLQRAHLLDNAARALLFEHIRREPGVHLASLIRVGNVGRGATRHHLDMLTKHGFLKAREDGGFLRYFVAGEVSTDEARRTAALRAGSHSAVHALYRETPGLTLREAAARLGMSAPNVHRIRKKLLAAGLLET